MRKCCNRCGRENTNILYQQGTCLSSNEVSNFNPNSSKFLPMLNLNNNIQSKSQMLINIPENQQPLFSSNFSYNVDSDNKKNKKKNRHFASRAGDWVCFKCNNLNFSFRTNCNRCHLTKSENQRLMYQQNYVQNLLYGNI